MIVVSILDNNITHAHTYVIVVLCVPVATHKHLPSRVKNITIAVHKCNVTRLINSEAIVK